MANADLQKIFLALRDHCIWVHDCFYTYESLYESNNKETDAALHVAASRFFRDLNFILIEYVMLQICKITDPAQTGRYKNLTINHLNEELRGAGVMIPEIEQLSTDIMQYRNSIIDARNRLISHLDRDTVLKELGIGAHPREKVDEFFKNLQAYTNAAGIAVGVGPLDYGGGGPGDVLDLIKILRRAQ
jgi:hypothetical protein